MPLLFLPLALALSAPSSQTADPTLPADANLLYTVEGRGVQIYHCVSQQGVFQWSPAVPDAKLIEPVTGKQLGTHSEGPTWTWIDGSSVRGKVVQRTPSPEPASIPWLLLSAQPAPRASGALSRVAWVRRAETHGGTAPATGCDAAHPSATARIPYTAVYTFYSPSAPHP